MRMCIRDRRGAWPQVVKRFEFEVFGSQDLELEAFNILGPCPWMLKASIWDGPPVWRFGNPNLQIGGPSQIEAFSIQGHGPRMLKASNSRSWGPKTSNSKVLTSWGHLSGWLDAKSFDLGWPPGLEVWGSKNIQIEAFTIQGHGPSAVAHTHLTLPTKRKIHTYLSHHTPQKKKH